MVLPCRCPLALSRPPGVGKAQLERACVWPLGLPVAGAGARCRVVRLAADGDQRQSATGEDWMTSGLTADPAAGGRAALASSAAGSAGRWSARRRLQTARGHLDAVMRMLEADRYCVDILHQLSAVEAAITRARQDVLATGVISAADVADDVQAAVFGGAAPPPGGERRAVR